MSDAHTAAPRTAGSRQAAAGLSFAAALVAAWLALHVYGMFVHRWNPVGIALAPLLILLQCWLDVGLFIVAHDAMHGSLAPRRPRVNRFVGRLALALYAGFSFDRLLPKHFAHHRHSGTEDDPDFNAGAKPGFWPWYYAFFRRYFGWREFAIISAVLAVYLFALGVSPANALLLWGLPAILSSLQLFYFGTYLPHRREGSAFVDRHNARSSPFGPLASLLTCFHFGGYHHEHHDRPDTPWWRLPGLRPGTDPQTGLE